MRKVYTNLVPAAVLAASMPTLADISYSQRIEIEGGGMMSMFSSTGETVSHISGDKARSESRMKMASRLASLAAGDQDTATIIRLDKGLTWNLQLDEQRYSEVSFAEARAQMEESMQGLEESGGGLPVSEEGCQWSERDVEVENDVDREKIAGIKSRKHVIRVRQSCTDPDTRKTCDMTWVMESWMAKNVPGEKEARAFHEKYMEAMGLDDVAQHVQGPGLAMLGMFGDNWDQVVDRLEDIKGYPLRTVMQMGMGGEQCTTAAGQPLAMDELWADASTSAYNAALEQAGYEAGSATGRAVGESLGESIAGNIGGAAVGAAAGELIGGLTGMFKKKKEPKETRTQASVSEGDRQVTLFRITTEVTEWSEVSVPDSRFEVPAGWKKI